MIGVLMATGVVCLFVFIYGLVKLLWWKKKGQPAVGEIGEQLDYSVIYKNDNSYKEVGALYTYAFTVRCGESSYETKYTKKVAAEGKSGLKKGKKIDIYWNEKKRTYINKSNLITTTVANGFLAAVIIGVFVFVLIIA